MLIPILIIISSLVLIGYVIRNIYRIGRYQYVQRQRMILSMRREDQKFRQRVRENLLMRTDIPYGITGSYTPPTGITGSYSPRRWSDY